MLRSLCTSKTQLPLNLDMPGEKGTREVIGTSAFVRCTCIDLVGFRFTDGLRSSLVRLASKE